MAHKPSWQPTTGNMGIRQLRQWVARESETFHEVNLKCEGYNHTNSSISQQVRLQYGRCAGQVPRTWEYKMKELEEGVIFRQRESPTIGGLFEWFNWFSQHQHHSTTKHLHGYSYISYRLYTYTVAWNIILCMSVYPSILGSGKKVSLPSWTKKSSHSSLQNLAIPACNILPFSATFPEIPKPKATPTTITARHCGPVATSSTQEHLNCCLGWPHVAICGSLLLFLRAHIQTWHQHNWTCCFNSDAKSKLCIQKYSIHNEFTYLYHTSI